jgi:hypothetical protein
MIECNGLDERVKRRYLHELKEKKGATKPHLLNSYESWPTRWSSRPSSLADQNNCARARMRP